MRRFWLCVFFVTCISAFAASYDSENMKSDAVTSATEYTGTPKKFKNGKAVDEQSATASAEESQEPKIVLPDENAAGEKPQANSAMRELPETFTEEKAEIALPDENAAGEESQANSAMRELPETFEEEKPTVALPDENAAGEESRANSTMRELPETIAEKNATVALPDENAANEESQANSAMRELPETFADEKAEVALPDENAAGEESQTNSAMRELPETNAEEKPTVALPDENAANEESQANSALRELPETFAEEKAEVALPDENVAGEESQANSAMRELPETLAEEKPTVALPDENAAGEESQANSAMRELPLPNALFEEDSANDDEDLPFIWDEDSKEEKPEQDTFRDEDLPTLLDVPEDTSEKIEKSEPFDVPDTGAQQNFVESDKNEYEKINNFAKSSKDLGSADKSAELETEWVFKKDSRKLMDFNENFAGFPKSDTDVFGNPAQYQYDNEKLVVESGRKIDNLTGARLYDDAVKYIKANENSKAAKLLKELLHYNFNVPETEYLLALAEFRSGNSDEATKYLKRSFRKNKNPYLRAKNMELLGEIAFSQKKYDEAYRHFISAIVGVNAKSDAQLYNKAGIAALRAGDIEKARKAWKIGKYLGSEDAERNLLWLDN